MNFGEGRGLKREGKSLMNEEFVKYIVSRLVDNAKDAAKEQNSDFVNGKRLAYYEMLDTVKNELFANDCDLKEFGLDLNLEEFIFGNVKETEEATKMTIKLYDRVKLKSGKNASIVEIFEQGVAYAADIDDGDECITETIWQEEIAEVIEND